MNMAQIRNKETYEAVMKRIDALFSETDENTDPSDPRLLELDLLSELVEEYEGYEKIIKEGTINE